MLHLYVDLCLLNAIQPWEAVDVGLFDMHIHMQHLAAGLYSRIGTHLSGILMKSGDLDSMGKMSPETKVRQILHTCVIVHTALSHIMCLRPHDIFHARSGTVVFVLKETSANTLQPT